MSTSLMVTMRKAAAPRPAQGARKGRSLPWPLLKAEDCHHLDLYPLAVLTEDREEYEVLACPLCGHVEHVQGARHGRRPPRGTVLLRKAASGWVDWKNDPRYRWITLKPQGDEGRGQPVLIRLDDPTGEGGSGTIVGGAGGSMNYRRISGVKTKGEYRTEARRKRAERREREAEKKERAREALRGRGLSEKEIKEREKEQRVAVRALKAKQEEAEDAYLREVAQLAGATDLPEELTGRQRGALRRHAKQMLRQVQEAVIEVHDQAMAEVLGSTRPEDLPMPELAAGGLGYQLAVEALAQENGLTPIAAQKGADLATKESLLAAQMEGYIESAKDAWEDVKQRRAAAEVERRAREAARGEEGEEQPEESLKLSEEVAPEQAGALLTLAEKHKQAMRELQAREREVAGAAPTDVVSVPAGSALLEIEEMTQAEAMKRVEQSLQERAQTSAAVNLLETVEQRTGGEASLQQHLLEGRNVQLDEVTQAVLHQPLPMRREVLDLLGPEAAAELVGGLLMRHVGEDAEKVAGALREEHISTQVQRAEEAMREAEAHLEAADHAFDGLGKIGELGPEGLEAASAAKAQALREREAAREVLGITLGRLQMLGHLNGVLAQKPGETVDVALGEMDNKRALEIAHALGLSPEDFELQTDQRNAYLIIGQSGWGKLLEKPDEEHARLYEAAQAIKRGDDDEEGWLAEGLMRRPSDAYFAPEQVQHSQGWEVDAQELLAGKEGEALVAGVREYAGRMLANDGIGSMASLRSRMLSAEWQADNLSERQQAEFADTVAEVFPAKAAEDNWTAVGEALVTPFLEAKEKDRVALDAQQVNTSSAWDPMHRALQEVPEGKVAFTAMSAMTPQDKALLRQYFWKHLTEEKPPSATETRERREETAAEAAEALGSQGFMLDMPAVEDPSIFVAKPGETEEARAARQAKIAEASRELPGGERTVTRGETEAFQQRTAGEEAEAAETAWDRYVHAQRGVGNAYKTIQALIQGDMAEKFAGHYARETGRALRTAPAAIPNALRHVIGIMPKASLDRVLDADNGALRKMHSGLRKRRAGGQYAEGEVADLAQRILEKAKKMQISLFAETPPSTQRLSVGQVAEGQMRRVWSHVAPNFDAERPVEIIESLSQSGKYVHQQRAIKMLEANRRVSINHSTGSGKSLVGIGAFTDLSAKGEVKRGLYLVPPKAQSQFGGEMNRYAEPGKFRHFADPSASAEERRAAYADPDRAMVAVSHQAWRTDVTWAVAQARFDGDTKKAARWLTEASVEEVGPAVQDALKQQGWQFGFQMVDEGHDTLNRQGKPDSRLARVVDATTQRADYFITATATTVKNDLSELYDLLCKVRPDKYQRGGWESFRRRYGLNTAANREALQRLVAPYLYAHNVDTGVNEHEYNLGLPLSDVQQAGYRAALEAYREARRAPKGSDERRAAVARLVPPEQLEGLTEEQRAQKLDDVGGALGFARDRAIARILEHTPAEHNPRIQKVVEIARENRRADDDGGQVPGLVFAQSLESVRLLADALKGEGFRVGTITGALNGEETELRRVRFNADGGRGQAALEEEAAARREMADYDILVGSEAASEALNLERARWLFHYDQAQTAMTMEQREGRANRLRQRWPNIAIYTAATDVPYERRRRELVDRKGALMSTFMEPTEQLDDTGLARAIREARGERLTGAVDRLSSGQFGSQLAAMQEAAT